MIGQIQQERPQDPSSLIYKAFGEARDRADHRRIHQIFGACGQCGDDRDLEALASACHLRNEAIASAFENPKLWDRRRTLNTRANLICNLANSHIKTWMWARGMDIAEARRLRDGGEE